MQNRPRYAAAVAFSIAGTVFTVAAAAIGFLTTTPASTLLLVFGFGAALLAASAACADGMFAQAYPCTVLIVVPVLTALVVAGFHHPLLADAAQGEAGRVSTLMSRADGTGFDDAGIVAALQGHGAQGIEVVLTADGVYRTSFVIQAAASTFVRGDVCVRAWATPDGAFTELAATPMWRGSSCGSV